MKKLSALILALVLAFSLAACAVSVKQNDGATGQPAAATGKNTAAGTSTSSPAGTTQPGFPADNSGSPQSGDALSGALDALPSDLPGGGNITGGLNDKWPADIVPDLPAYPYGKITGFTGPDSDGEIIIKAGETSQADLDKYLQSLKDAGWTVTKSVGEYDYDYTAEKGAYTVYLDLQIDTLVQFNVIIAKTGAWPSADEYPVPFGPPEGYTIVNADISLNDVDGQEYYEFSFGDVGMNAAAAEKYVSDKTEFGFDWKGKHWNCMFEVDISSFSENKSEFVFTIYQGE
ncbi:MAG: hypothetical protein FWC55_07065 [Firmicutes bacterium]|nr:hypothetical protein [Bacillota bacterium]